MPLTFDQYSFCSLGCLYCFAYFFKSNNPVIDEVKLKQVDVDHLLKNIRGECTAEADELWYNCFYRRRFLLHWGGLADPFCNFERRNRAGFRLIEGLAAIAYPTLFSFKGNAILDDDYQRLFHDARDKHSFAFQVSMVTDNDALARIVEIGVPSPSKRLEAIGKLHDMGYWTILRLRPYIIGITDRSIDSLLSKAKDAGVDGVSLEFMALDARANEGMKKRYDWLAKVMGVPDGDLMAYFRRLSPSVRGGYMRLNRHVKEAHVRQVFEFCQANGMVFGCSDPDFKELNTSGSCCAMPSKFEQNPEMCNWTTRQLTWHLKEARVAYHTTGQLREFLFDDVYGSAADSPWLDANKLAIEHVTVIPRCQGERQVLSQRIILQEQWNNLRSPSCPCNYLHAKVLPCGVDTVGNLRFVYNPMEYEERWASEGVNMEY